MLFDYKLSSYRLSSGHEIALFDRTSLFKEAIGLVIALWD